MKTIIVKATVLGGCVMTLVASGGGTTTNPPPIVTTPSYETLSSTAAKTSTLAGTAIQTNNISNAVTRVDISGSLTHNTGAMSVNGGTLTPNGTQGFTGTYDYVTVYEQNYRSDGINYTYQGIVGVVTSAGDVPGIKSGKSATYTGEATGQIVTRTTGFDLNSGTSTVIADFNSGTVDVTMTDFTAVYQGTGNAPPVPIDTIRATGMTITGNAFSGGTLATTNAGSTVNLTGTNTTNSAGGNFFGYDAAISAPDETGGIILLQGDSGIVMGAFIAD